MNWLRTTVLLAGLTALLLVAGQALGGQQGLVIALGLAVVMNIGSYWFSDRLVLSMYGAREVGPGDAPELYATVQGLAKRAGLPMPKVYIVNSDTPNAFATGRNPAHAAVAATTGIMRLLSRDELAGVMAHELSHVKHRDTLIGAIAATVAVATPCWPAPVSAMMRRLPMRLASSAWPMVLFTLWAPVWLRSSRLR